MQKTIHWGKFIEHFHNSFTSCSIGWSAIRGQSHPRLLHCTTSMQRLKLIPFHYLLVPENVAQIASLNLSNLQSTSRPVLLLLLLHQLWPLKQLWHVSVISRYRWTLKLDSKSFITCLIYNIFALIVFLDKRKPGRPAEHWKLQQATHIYRSRPRYCCLVEHEIINL